MQSGQENARLTRDNLRLQKEVDEYLGNLTESPSPQVAQQSSTPARRSLLEIRDPNEETMPFSGGQLKLERIKCCSSAVKEPLKTCLNQFVSTL